VEKLIQSASGAADKGWRKNAMKKKKAKKAKEKPQNGMEAGTAVESHAGVEDMRILDELKKSYLNYAMSVHRKIDGKIQNQLSVYHFLFQNV
jgi:hypothetical protein